MSQTPWYLNFALIEPYIFKIRTSLGSGTGFQLFSNDAGLCGIATAYHVIENAEAMEEPIKITHYGSNKSLVLKADAASRTIFTYPKEDLAFILFPKKNLDIKAQNPTLVTKGLHLNPGNEVAWCGFPSVAPDNLCFFAGYTSCYIDEGQYYLIDGVVINGVSGGPVFFINDTTNKLELCGVISAYVPNRATGEALPGLGVVRQIDPYQKELETLKSLDEAVKVKKAEEEKTKESSPKG